MTIAEADALKVGDPVMCTAAGLSQIRYREGDVGTVRLKAGAFFAVTLSDGRETGITAPGNWELWFYEERDAQTAKKRTPSGRYCYELQSQESQELLETLSST